MQPNSYAHEMNHIPHDPDEKDRELNLDIEEYHPNGENLKTGIVVWFPERKLRNLLSDTRISALGPNLESYTGWAMILAMTVDVNLEHPQRSQVNAALKFETSGLALGVEFSANTPWVVRK